MIGELWWPIRHPENEPSSARGPLLLERYPPGTTLGDLCPMAEFLGEAAMGSRREGLQRRESAARARVVYKQPPMWSFAAGSVAEIVVTRSNVVPHKWIRGG